MRGVLAAALLLVALAAAASTAAAADPQPDLRVSLAVEPSAQGENLTAGAPARVIITVSNVGSAPAGAFEVDVWCTDPSWARRSVQVSSLLAGANASLPDNETYSVGLAESVDFFAVADPADRIVESDETDNSARLTAVFAPPPARFDVVAVSDRIAGNATLPPYTVLVLVLDVGQGESILFEAEAPAPQAFDQYLLDEANWTIYRNATVDPGAVVGFFHDYSPTDTTHAAFTTVPLPAGRYYLVIENDERLRGGVRPTGPVNVTYAAAIVNSSLPPALLAVVIGAAIAAIWATVKWRPAFDVRSPLLEVPPPDPSELEDEDAESGGDEGGGPELEKGNEKESLDEPEMGPESSEKSAAGAR
jgi:hypothetical protein